MQNPSPILAWAIPVWTDLLTTLLICRELKSKDLLLLTVGFGAVTASETVNSQVWCLSRTGKKLIFWFN